MRLTPTLPLMVLLACSGFPPASPKSIPSSQPQASATPRADLAYVSTDSLATTSSSEPHLNTPDAPSPTSLERLGRQALRLLRHPLFVAFAVFFLTQLVFRAHEARSRTNAYCSHLRVVASEVKKNLDLRCQLHAYFFVHLLPSFDMSLFAEKHVLPSLAAHSKNDALLRMVFNDYFECGHIQNRLQAARTMKLGPTPDAIKAMLAKSAFDSYCDRSAEIINGSIQGALELYNAILAELQAMKSACSLSPLALEYLDDRYDYFQTERFVMQAIERGHVDISQRPRHYERTSAPSEEHERDCV